MTSHPKGAASGPRELPNGQGFIERCDLCHVQMYGETLEDLDAQTCACGTDRVTVYISELTCLMCGREMGTLETPDPVSRVLLTHGMRCDVCGGVPTIADSYAVSRYAIAPLPPAKRGRPFKAECHA